MNTSKSKINRNHCLQFNSLGLDQTFVLEKENHLIWWDFSPVSENLESGPVPGPKESGCVSLLSLLLCPCLVISFYPTTHCFTQSASQARPAASCSLPAWEAMKLSQASYEIHQYLGPHNSLPLIHSFIHLMKITEELACTSHCI